ncbi:MAG TPA: class I SAM-dependent methyltransferase [Steroidobacteraceae bacterium]|nr:class I SAM-dependent methyltransferase [Steroidobacteraceae bacterium]
MNSGVNCRFCGGPLAEFVDLGMSPLCESYLTENQLNSMEPFYPLAACVCRDCLLVQLQEYVAPEHIFSEYAYFSAYSDAWVEHARRYAETMTERLSLGPASYVIELGSNDGYLLQFFVEKGIPVLGIDPAANIAGAAEARGVPTLVTFFGLETARELAEKGNQADLVVGNNVLAQVANLNSFVEGIRLILKPQGVCTIEFPHLFKTMVGNQFDQIYHEHFSYFSAFTAEKIFAAHGMRIFDVEELWTHGGSLRIYACHAGDASHPTAPSVSVLARREREAGLHRLETYADFADRVRATKRKLLSFLIEAKTCGKSLVGYGAPGKGNTLLNYCGIRTDFLDYTVDRNPYKQGRYLPGTHIPIFSPEKIAETRPDYVLILPWNLKDEITTQLSYIRSWSGRFVVPIPEVSVI